MQLLNRAVVATLPLVPKPLVGLFARPYVAGDTLAQALETVDDLAREGCRATVDVLGEEASSRQATLAYVEQYEQALDRVVERPRECNVSIKLSALGQRFAPELCEENLRRIVRRARERGSFVRLDMEDSTTTSATLDLYRRLRRDFDNLGIVLQARLLRTSSDVAELLELKPNVRVVKGIYLERLEISHHDPQRIRDAYVDTVRTLVEGGCRVALATHDDQLVERSLELVERAHLGREEYEFQMLLGVRPGLRRELVGAGQRVRVYVPFGRDWLAYSLRRLKENPAVAGHVLRNLITLGRL